MSLTECAYCGHENRPDCNYCTQCGIKLNDEKRSGPLLRMLRNEDKTTVFKLVQGKSTVGRDLNNDIIIEDQLVSKSHAAVYVENGDIYIEDMNSSNGVYVNGKKISRRIKVNNGSLIRVGSTILKLESNYG